MSGYTSEGDEELVFLASETTQTGLCCGGSLQRAATQPCGCLDVFFFFF